MLKNIEIIFYINEKENKYFSVKLNYCNVTKDWLKNKNPNSHKVLNA